MNRYVIDQKALEGNIATVIKHCDVPVIGVVKANGYGVGLEAFASTLKAHGVKTFAITELSDIEPLKGVLSRDDDILMMRSTALSDELDAIVSADCVASIGSCTSVRALDEAAQRAGKHARCHIKVDTGFGRYGFFPDQMDEIASVFTLPNVDVQGIYTHFARAYGDEAYTKAQLAAFMGVVEDLKARGLDPGCVHAANSPALYNFPETTLDAVRIGSAFLGRVITQADTDLERIGYLETEVIDIKDFPCGWEMGYGGVEKLKRPTKVAFAGAGQREGVGLQPLVAPDMRSVLSKLKRLGKHPLEATINGHAYLVLGEPDLSLCLLDVTGSDVSIGDKVVFDPNPLMVPASVSREYI